MNERIRELFKEAYGYFPSPLGEQESEKFAELIVKKCAMIADFAHLGGIIEPGVMIKEYFGVE